jgi:DNA gyrase/topoisomerase IV subunit B
MVESYRPDNTAGKVEFHEGRINSKGLQKIKCKNNKHGLITTFCPSDMMGNITTTVDEIQNLTWLITHLCIRGTKVLFNAIDNMGRTRKVMIENKNGIFELIDGICEKKVFNPVYFTEDNGTMKVEVLFSYDVANMDDPKIMGFANMCPTSSGTHIDGFLDAIVKYFRDYMNKIYLANNKKLQVNAQDIRTGLRAVISVFHVKPMFTG